MLVYQRVRVVILNWPEKSSQHEHHDIGSQNATAVAHSYHDPTCLLCVGPFFPGVNKTFIVYINMLV
jgi:hypothetical protein